MSAYGLWCLGIFAETTNTGIGVAIQIGATILIGIIGFLVRSQISSMEKAIQTQGERIRYLELGIVRIASNRGIKLPRKIEDVGSDE